ncbi:hypothetical protein [Streptomyces cyaneofuscatus]|uniref:hypothetical protein n=1 Tax=Streptomyces cyaneofuscatus TaxID=66883 RepID=UPI0033AB4AB1
MIETFVQECSILDRLPLLTIEGNSCAYGSDILPQTETQGTAEDASSIYAVRFGQAEEDRAVTGLANGGIQVSDLGELDSKRATARGSNCTPVSRFSVAVAPPVLTALSPSNPKGIRNDTA